MALAPAAARPSLQAPAATTDIPRPHGFYVLNDAGNNRNAAKAYSTGLTTSSGYLNSVTGHAIFVPIAKILPSVAGSAWGDFHWAWGYMDTLVQTATSHGKAFSLEFETGVQNTGSNYLQSLPAAFADSCGPDCAPLYDVWVGGAPPGTCTSSFILLPWIPKVQQFWTLLADSVAEHLHGIGAYGSLTLVHVPGLSVYDEELRLPTGNPKPDSTNTTICPDGRPAYPTTITDADTSRWRGYGYSDAAAIAGFGVIATAFANAFPDRVLGLSLFPEGKSGRSFPNLTNDTTGTVPSALVAEVAHLAPGRVQIQADDLDVGVTYSEVVDFAPRDATAIGWQSNRHSGTGATCGGGPCGPDTYDSPYFQLLQTGALARGAYTEIWSSDVLSYPFSLAEADSAGFGSILGVPLEAPIDGGHTRLLAEGPNPAHGGVELRIEVAPAISSGLRLEVLDVTGREVKSMALGRSLSAGIHEVAWNGVTDRGNAAPSGVYYALLEQGERSLGRLEFVLLR